MELKTLYQIEKSLLMSIFSCFNNVFQEASATKKYHCHWPSILKFTALMSSITAEIINSLSKYVFVALKHTER